MMMTIKNNTPHPRRILIINLVAITSALFFYGCPDEKPVTPGLTSGDTTSHNFQWQIDTLGDGNGSIIYDVAIINDTLIYAVGELYLKDSLGKTESTPYGIGIWDGKKWRLKQIFARYPNSNTPLRPRGVIAFSRTDVWFAWGDVFHWDGKSDTVKIHRLTMEVTNPNAVLGLNQNVNRLWGTSSADLWAVGSNGAMAHYNGTIWQKIESGTTTPILDLWGTIGKVYCAVTNMMNLEEAKILTVTKNSVIDSLSWPNTNRINSVWCDNKQTLYVCGNGIFRYEHAEWQEMPVPGYFYQRIRGSCASNVFAVGALGMVVHFNGNTWQHYPEVMNNGAFFGVDVKANIVCAVGISGNRGITVIGKQQP